MLFFVDFGVDLALALVYRHAPRYLRHARPERLAVDQVNATADSRAASHDQPSVHDPRVSLENTTVLYVQRAVDHDDGTRQRVARGDHDAAVVDGRMERLDTLGEFLG